MRSIRVSLILYFLLLMGVALGLVLFRVYRTNVETVEDKRSYVAQLLRDKLASEVAQIRNALDVRLSRRVQLLARLANNHRYHFEALYPLGAVGAFALPNGHLFGPTWLAEGMEPALAIPLYELQPPIIRIQSANDIMASVANEQPTEYFQTFDLQGVIHERSASLGAASFALDTALRPKTADLGETYDNVILGGKVIRRVTIKTASPTMTETFLPQPWVKDMDASDQERWAHWQSAFAKKDPTVFVQYASLTTAIEAEHTALRQEFDQALIALDADNERVLATLRTRLLWISAATFIAVVVGGFWLIRAGLHPLNRLSLAVSRVSEHDFNLRLRADQFPAELKPIVQCLTEAFGKLQRAFEREKQSVADISHELRTPIAAFLANLEVILRKPRSADEYRQVLEDCRDAGQHLSRLVERLLTLARLDAGSDTLRPQHVDAAVLAQQCAAMVRPLADVRGVRLRLHLHDSVPMQVDPDKLREVFNNLLHNAIEYNRPNGSIDLTVRRENGNVCVAVRDTGIGIPAEARERIFERFYRVDPSRQADSLHAGIGLAIVKSYVDLMGGKIRIESSDEGSTFHLTLPASGYRLSGT